MKCAGKECNTELREEKVETTSNGTITILLGGVKTPQGEAWCYLCWRKGTTK